MVSASQQQLTNYLNTSVWSAYTRINASERFQVVADGGVLIPPDTARVAMHLLEYEKAVYGGLVRNFVMPHDAALTEEYRRSPPRGANPLPAGATFLSPWQDHLALLEASWIIPRERVWATMPPELYLINNPNLTPAQRALLEYLGYAEAAADKAMGREVYTPNPEAIALADAKRAALPPTAKAWGNIVVGLAQLGLFVFGAATAIYYIGKLLGAVTYRWEHSQEWKIEAQKAANTAQGLRLQMVQAEDSHRMLEEHCGAGSADPWSEERCASILATLAAIKPVTDAPKIPMPSSCGFGLCWPWALAAFGGGAVIGGLIAKKRGWV